MKKLRLKKETLVNLQASNHQMKDLDTPDMKNKVGGISTPAISPLTPLTQHPTGCTCTPRWVSLSAALSGWATKKTEDIFQSFSASAQDPSIKPSWAVQPSMPVSY